MNLAEPDLDKHIAALCSRSIGVPARLLELGSRSRRSWPTLSASSATLSRIAAMGSTIALDDFGIGNTSISQLRDLPIDTPGSTRSFILDMSNGNEVLVKVVTELAHEFEDGRRREGVEEHDVAERACAGLRPPRRATTAPGPRRAAGDPRDVRHHDPRDARLGVNRLNALQGRVRQQVPRHVARAPVPFQCLHRTPGARRDDEVAGDGGVEPLRVVGQQWLVQPSSMRLAARGHAPWINSPWA